MTFLLVILVIHLWENHEDFTFFLPCFTYHLSLLLTLSALEVRDARKGKSGKPTTYQNLTALEDFVSYIVKEYTDRNIFDDSY